MVWGLEKEFTLRQAQGREHRTQNKIKASNFKHQTSNSEVPSHCTVMHS
jgi:hypothetical protein